MNGLKVLIKAQVVEARHKKKKPQQQTYKSSSLNPLQKFNIII